MTAETVRIRLLGAFEVTVGDSVAVTRFPTRRSGELVQLLALVPGRRLVRDQVIEALWPHLDASAGGANLRKAAHHARLALGRPDAVELHQQQVALFPRSDVVTDADEFVGAADRALAAHDPAAARAAALGYTGVLLPGSLYEPWTEDLRRVLAARHLELLRLGGRWDRVFELDPLDETAAREVMRAARDAGQRHRVMAVYGRLRSALSLELGVLPQRATEELYAGAVDGPASVAPPFVGREEALSVVDSLVHRSRGSALVLVRGASGMGKSSFVNTAVERTRSAGGVAALVLADSPDDAFATLRAVVEALLLGEPAAAVRLNERSRAVLARLTPVVRGAGELDMPLTRHQLIGAVQRLVEVAGDRVLVVVDDTQRADPSSLDVLAQLAERAELGPVVVFAYRAEDLGPVAQQVISRAERRRAPTIIDLEPLAHDELNSLAHSLVTPADTIGRRLLDLDDDIIAWLRRLSLVDGPLDLATVTALTGCREAALIRLLDAAMAAGVLRAHQGQYRFGNELVRRALAEQLPPHRAIAVHRDAALRLADLGARPGIVAHHWLAGQRPERAVEWLLRAADDAVGLGGYPAAVEHLDRIIEHDPRHAEALNRRAAALDAMGDPRAIAAYDAAARVASGDDVHELRPLQALAMVKLGDPEGGMRVIAGAEPKRLESQLAKALAYCGAGLMGHADPDIGARLAAEGRVSALRAGDPSAIVVASWAQAGAAHARGELRASLSADLSDTHALPRLAVSVFDGQLCITQRLLYGSRPYDDVIRWADAFAAEAGRLGAARGLAFATTLRGEAELLSGRLDDAEANLRRGRQLHRDMSAATGESFSLQRLAELTATRGDLRGAHRLLDESLAVARESDVGFHLFDRIYGARIALTTDPSAAVALVDEAEELVRGPFETCPGCRITLAVPAAIALARAGELDRLAAYEASCAWLADVVMQLPAWYAAVDEVRAHRCIAHGDVAAARLHFGEALAGYRGAGQPHDVARCAADLAGLHA